MATSYIGNSENLQQVVITPNKGLSRAGSATSQDSQPQERLSPAQVRNQSAIRGRMAAAQAEANEGRSGSKGGEGFWGEDGFTFGDLIDIINPLQHIPIVSTIYRAITGDEIGAGPRMIGGAALGGVAGFAASAVGAMVHSETGMEVGEHVLASMTGAKSQNTTSVTRNSTESGAVLLSSADPVTHMAEDLPPPPTAEEVMAAQGIALDNGVDISKERAIYALGGWENATQRYQQTQMMDRMQDTALGMDIKS